MNDQLERELASLRIHAPDEARTRRIRQRYRTSVGHGKPASLAEPAVVVGACAGYLLAVMRTALVVLGF